MKQFISLALLGVCLLALLPSQASGAYYPRVPQVGTISDKTMGPNKDHPWGGDQYAGGGALRQRQTVISTGLPTLDCFLRILHLNLSRGWRWSPEREAVTNGPQEPNITTPPSTGTPTRPGEGEANW